MLNTNKKHLVKIDENGTLSFIYSDNLRGFNQLGEVSTSRASHVEPIEGGKWTADMEPVEGPVLGPFDTRQEALDTEVEYLKENIFR